MEKLTIEEIIQAVNGRYLSTYNTTTLQNICTDSRKVVPGDLYIALKGENFDGHDFIQASIEKGAQAIIASKAFETTAELPVILVQDTLEALGDLATYYRTKLAKPVVAVTGSVGKTSTKDIIATILSSTMNIHKSKGNFNNEIGLPLSIFGLQIDHDAMVLEMGMWAEGEIRGLTHIAQPSIAVITNIGLSHIERLGTQENILKAKLEIVEGLTENGLLILNEDDTLLSKVDRKIYKRVVTVGIDHPSDYQALNVKDLGLDGMFFEIELLGTLYPVKLPAIGRHNVLNTLAGIACSMELGLSPDEILKGISSYQPDKMRLNIIDRDGIRFIDDTYNASPDSMEAGLKVLKSLSKNHRGIAILGNMFELGHMAESAHFNLGQKCREMGVDFMGFIGENASDVEQGIAPSHAYKIFQTHEEIVGFMKDFLKSGDVVLLKGSRGMTMERILELWS